MGSFPHFLLPTTHRRHGTNSHRHVPSDNNSYTVCADGVIDNHLYTNLRYRYSLFLRRLATQNSDFLSATKLDELLETLSNRGRILFPSNMSFGLLPSVQPIL